MRTQKGFTLIELIAVIVIMGFISIFAGSMFNIGARGVLASRQAEENGQKGQIALTRIAAELRDVNGGPGASSAPTVTSTAIAYTSSNALLTGARILAYDAAGKRITLSVAGTAYTLIDGVSSCTMSANTTYTPTFTVTFALTDTSGSFSITVKPRNIITPPIIS